MRRGLTRLPTGSGQRGEGRHSVLVAPQHGRAPGIGELPDVDRLVLVRAREAAAWQECQGPHGAAMAPQRGQAGLLGQVPEANWGSSEPLARRSSERADRAPTCMEPDTIWVNDQWNAVAY